MYVRKKKYPSGNVGIIVVEKVNGKMRELVTIGIAKSEDTDAKGREVRSGIMPFGSELVSVSNIILSRFKEIYRTAIILKAPFPKSCKYGGMEP